MRFFSSGGEWATALVAATGLLLLSPTPALAADSTTYTDPETGFLFSRYAAKYDLQNNAVSYGIAVPSDASAAAPYDVVLQMAAPIASSQGWAGLAWGGTMVNCPLVVAWMDGRGGVVGSARMVGSHVYPPPSSAISLTPLKTGTHVNATHWQITAKCTGCTTYGSTTLDPKKSHRLAFAWASTRPATPTSSASTFGVHDIYGYWDHDFKAGANDGWEDLVAKNSG